MSDTLTWFSLTFREKELLSVAVLSVISSSLQHPLFQQIEVGSTIALPL